MWRPSPARRTFMVASVAALADLLQRVDGYNLQNASYLV
jgi:hypothetical protein